MRPSLRRRQRRTRTSKAPRRSSSICWPTPRCQRRSSKSGHRRAGLARTSCAGRGRAWGWSHPKTGSKAPQSGASPNTRQRTPSRATRAPNNFATFAIFGVYGHFLQRWRHPWQRWQKTREMPKEIQRGTTNETTRDTVQRILVGRSGRHGTRSIPKDAILELVPARGTPDLLDSIKIRHVSGGVSVIGLKSYQRGRESFQGETLDYLWFDEEPPADIFTEGLTRTNVNQGPVWVTFTPLLGMSEVVRRFLLEPSPGRNVTTMTLDDVAHYSAEEKEQIAASYAAHEREARTKGVPTLGSGRIFPVTEEMLACEQPDFPTYCPPIGPMHFVSDPPFPSAALLC